VGLVPLLLSEKTNLETVYPAAADEVQQEYAEMNVKQHRRREELSTTSCTCLLVEIKVKYSCCPDD
jgi:hypothetical protein